MNKQATQRQQQDLGGWVVCLYAQCGKRNLCSPRNQGYNFMGGFTLFKMHDFDNPKGPFALVLRIILFRE